MRVYNSLDEYRPHKNGAAVALGFFDGVHTGHRAVIGACTADSGILPCTVLTFGESPARALGKPVPPLLCDNERKAELMAELGVDELIFADFAAVKELSPEEFIQKILCETLNARQVTCGFNYRFGHRGAGGTETLTALCEQAGISVSVREPVICGGEQVSSSRIRERITAGEIEDANAMLGYRYTIGGRIGSGNQIGGDIGFPTVNLPIGEGLIIPRSGVYASEVVIDGKRYRGATNIGVHPTVGASEKPLCETFLLHFDGGDLYGRQAACELIRFVRPERRFDSVDALKRQIKEDCETILADFA